MSESVAFEGYQVIHVRGGAFAVLERHLHSWFEDHLHALAPQAYIQLCKLARGNHVVLLSKDIHYLHFFKVLHFINGIGEKTFNGKATGYTHLPRYEKIPDELTGQWVMGIVPEFGASFYLSSICSQVGKTYRCNRYGKIRPVDFDTTFQPLGFDPGSLKVASTINEKKFRHSSNHPVNTQLPKKSERFFFFLLFPVGTLMLIMNIQKPDEHILALSISFGLLLLSGLWIYLDIRILKDKRMYSVMAIVSSLLVLVSKILLPGPESLFPYFITLLVSIPLTLFLLLVPKPWKLSLKDKSILDGQVHSVEDFAYMAMLVTAVSGVIMVLINA